MSAYATALKESSKEAILAEALRLHDQLAAAEEKIKLREEAVEKQHGELQTLWSRAESAETTLTAARAENERLTRAYEAHGGSWKYCATGHCDKQICPDGPSYICICRDAADGSCDLAEYWQQQNEYAERNPAALRAQLAAAEERTRGTYCVYCGERFDREKPASNNSPVVEHIRNQVTEHMLSCKNHPYHDALASARADAVRDAFEWALGTGVLSQSRQCAALTIDKIAARCLTECGVPRARPDDGRVERAARCLFDTDYENRHNEPFPHDTRDWHHMAGTERFHALARAAIAAADGGKKE